MAPTDPDIASPSNPRIRAAVRLRDRSEREQRGLTIVDGARELRRAIEGGATIDEAFICEPLIRTPDAEDAVAALRSTRVPLVSVTQAAFEKLAFGDRSDGLVALVRIPDTRLEGLQLRADPLLVVIEAVEKPGNVGATLRSADGAGADAVIAADPRTDLFNPNAIRASLGTMFTVPVAAAPTPDVIAFLRDRAIGVVAARVDATTLYTDVDLRGPVAIVFGSEAEGLTDAWAAADVTPVRLPMLGVADSLNVSVSAAILLYEARRQRGIPR
ncbi:MAG: TrmH family RNA methyltransferase [Chloroflexota bacterium]